MLRHYLKTAVRSLLRRKFHSAINVFGLAVGLALCLTVVGHIANEISFERFHTNLDNICRLEGKYSFEEENYKTARSLGPMGPALAEGLAEVERAAVFRKHEVTSVTVGGERVRVINEHKNKGYAHGNKLIFADASYLDVFTFPLLSGAKSVLDEPNSILITEKAAREFFENEDPVGQQITLNDNVVCEVRGILKDIPQNTQLHSQFVVSYSTLGRIGEEIDSWSTFGEDYVYLLLGENVDPAALQSRLGDIAGRYLSSEQAAKYEFSLMPMKDIYFSVYGSGKQYELSPAGEASFIYESGGIALLILIIAIANFINLSTARAAERMKEVGVRKVFGAFRSHLIRQYLGESLMVALAAMLVSVLTYEVIKVLSYSAMPRQYLIDFYDSPLMLAAVLGLVVVVGLIAGFYPALYLSRFRPIAVLQGKSRISSSKSWLRRTLVVFQFTIASLFVFCTTVMMRQVDFISKLDVGFDRENIVLLDFEGETAAEDCALMKNEIQINNRSMIATSTNCPPGRKSYTYYGFYTDERRRDEDSDHARLLAADHDFVSLFGLRLVEGSNLTEQAATEERVAIIVTEGMVKNLELDRPVGSRLYRSEGKFYEIIGVVEDFEPAPAGVSYTPNTIIASNANLFRTLAVKLPRGDVAESLAAIQATWEKTLPGYAFTYAFLDDEMDAALAGNRGESQAFLVLSIFAISIACLGIFGLVSFTTEQRCKEIGVRKVLGASVPGLVKLLSKEFVILTLIANVIALPLGTLLMTDILRWFANRVTMGPGTYLFVIVVVVLVALFTTAAHSFRAASANPIDALRSE